LRVAVVSWIEGEAPRFEGKLAELEHARPVAQVDAQVDKAEEVRSQGQQQPGRLDCVIGEQPAAFEGEGEAVPLDLAELKAGRGHGHAQGGVPEEAKLDAILVMLQAQEAPTYAVAQPAADDDRNVHGLGERLGRTDVRRLRQRIGYLSASLSAQLRPELRCLDVVMTAKYAALEPWWHRYTLADEQRAKECLDRMGVAWAAERSLGTVSSGEQQRVLLARTLMNEPGIVLLDEPSARLDLGGREHLVQALSELTLDPLAPPLVLVTHHLDEVPPGITHVMMLRDGAVIAKGALDDCLTSDLLSRCFGLPLQLERRPDGRFSAWHAPASPGARDRS